MSALQWYVVSSCVLNAVVLVALVGRKREPVTPTAAAIQVAIYAAIVAMALTWWAP
jgi:hypothetical protein